jgi:hypothetical protein
MSTFTIKGNTSISDAQSTASARKVPHKTIMDVYKSYDRSMWYSIAAACFNDVDKTDTNKGARYWRQSVKPHVRVEGLQQVVDFIFESNNVRSLDTLAKTYCPDLYADAREQVRNQ